MNMIMAIINKKMANKIGLVGVLIVIKLLFYLGLIGIEIANIEDH